jgi:hypothetical protein
MEQVQRKREKSLYVWEVLEHSKEEEEGKKQNEQGNENREY